MEKVVIMNISDPQLREACAGRRVLVTGHTGFKGSWLTLWLASAGAEVSGLALAAEDPSMFRSLDLASLCRHREGDVRDYGTVERAIADARPEFVFHLAAQSLVRQSYVAPLETIQTNIVGTANVLEAVRRSGRRCVVVIVTSDKCYENRNSIHGYRETDRLGGHDVYSMSKAAAELVVSSYRRSFFSDGSIAADGVKVASVRAGNVIGGGDWAVDRIVPDCIRALRSSQPVMMRNPNAVRPWQHVLEPLSGYLRLAISMDEAPDAERFCDAWNFGPDLRGARTVRELVSEIIKAWGSGSSAEGNAAPAVHEAAMLRLSIDKAAAELGWSPRWSFEETCGRTVEWYREAQGLPAAAARDLTLRQLDDFVFEGANAESRIQVARKATH